MSGATKNIVIVLLVVALIAIVGILLLSPSSKGKGPIFELDSAGVRDFARDGATIIDVRTPSEYAAGHLAGAVNIETPNLANGLASADKTAPLVVYCASGSRSRAAVDQLKALGFTNIGHLTKGIISWDGELVGGTAPGDPATLYAGTAGSGTTGQDDPLKNALIAPKDLPVMVEFATDT